MRSKFKWIFTLLLALTLQFSFAQEKTVTGVVSDDKGTLPGANVVVKGTTRGTQTDIDGKYSIQARTGEVLIFSFVGMQDISMTVGASNTISVTLKQGVALTEVVIDGYKTTSKKKASVAQTTLTAEAVENRPNVSFLQSLQSQVAGLNIGTSSGSPGSAKIDVLLRGNSSVNGNTSPLYVIDGVAANQVVFRSLNSQDIASITVLKDAGATAIYGNRGANGVIVVTTKKGKYDSKLSVRYSGSTGFTTLQDHDYRLTNSKQILRLENQLNTGLGGTLTEDQINAFPINTNWKDHFFRTGLSQSHNLSFQQGGANMNNYTSIGYFQQDGIVPTTDFKRFTFRTNFTGKSDNGKFTYTTNLAATFSQRNQLDQETRTDINANILQNPLQGLLSSLPYIDPNTYVNGQQLFDEFGAPSFEIAPLMLLDYINEGNIPNLYRETKLVGQLVGSYKLTNDLTYSATFGVDYAENKRLFARAPWSYLAIVATPAGAQYGGIERQNSDIDVGFNFQNRLNWTKTFKEKHTVDVNLFTEYIKAHRRTFQYTQTGLDPRTWSLGAGTGYVGYDGTGNYVPTVLADKIDTGLFSYFATADYDYDGRFGVVGTIRRDASYRFIEDNRWGTFWSVSARWNIDREKFMEGAAFDQLKLRASHGTTGNQNIVGAAYGVNPLFTANDLTRDLVNFGTGYAGDGATFVGQIANRDLQWEVTTQTNVGVDFSFKRRLSGSLDLYRKTTDKLFDAGRISWVNGQATIDKNVDYLLLNSGVELSLRYEVFKKGDFKLAIWGNGSYNKNELKDVVYDDPTADENAFGNVYNANGQPLFSYFLVPYVGVNPENGNLLFLDQNNNLTETPVEADRRRTGKSAIPTYQGGFGFNADYKGFFIDANFSYAADVYKFDFDLLNLSNPTAIGQFPVVGDLTHAWSLDNPNSNVPSLTATNVELAESLSDRFLMDASFVRLKALSFGYDVPAKLLEKTSFTGVKIYCQMENMLTWSKWRGFDVEGLNSSNQGGYPSPKVISFGVDIDL